MIAEFRAPIAAQASIGALKAYLNQVFGDDVGYWLNQDTAHPDVARTGKILVCIDGLPETIDALKSPIEIGGQTIEFEYIREIARAPEI